MNDEFFTHLAEFGKRLDFVDCVDVDVALLPLINHRTPRSSSGAW